MKQTLFSLSSVLPLSPPGRCRLGSPAHRRMVTIPLLRHPMSSRHAQARSRPLMDQAGGNYHNGPRYQSELIRQVNKHHRAILCGRKYLQYLFTANYTLFSLLCNFLHMWTRINIFTRDSSVSGISSVLASGLFKNSYKSFSWRVHKLETKLNMVQSLNFEQLQLNHFSNTIPPTLTPFRQKK